MLRIDTNISTKLEQAHILETAIETFMDYAVGMLGPIEDVNKTDIGKYFFTFDIKLSDEDRPFGKRDAQEIMELLASCGVICAIPEPYINTADSFCIYPSIRNNKYEFYCIAIFDDSQ